MDTCDSPTRSTLPFRRIFAESLALVASFLMQLRWKQPRFSPSRARGIALWSIANVASLTLALLYAVILDGTSLDS